MSTWMGWAAALLLGITALILLRRPMRALFRMLGRMAVGLAGLFAFGQIGGLIGVGLGVNLFNALVVALLGLPGFGFLLMTNWVLQI